MRPLLILAPLAMLVLSSCEPGEDNADAGNIKPHDRHDRLPIKFPANTANQERIAAQDSVDRAPQPRNLIANVADICPVHHEKMRIREIPIVFEETADGIESANAEFPFGAEKIVSTGNALLPGEPLTARVYQCAACIAARKAAEEKRQHPASAAVH